MSEPAPDSPAATIAAIMFWLFVVVVLAGLARACVLVLARAHDRALARLQVAFAR